MRVTPAIANGRGTPRRFILRLLGGDRPSTGRRRAASIARCLHIYGAMALHFLQQAPDVLHASKHMSTPAPPSPTRPPTRAIDKRHVLHMSFAGTLPAGGGGGDMEASNLNARQGVGLKLLRLNLHVIFCVLENGVAHQMRRLRRIRCIVAILHQEPRQTKAEDLVLARALLARLLSPPPQTEFFDILYSLRLNRKAGYCIGLHAAAQLRQRDRERERGDGGGERERARERELRATILTSTSDLGRGAGLHAADQLLSAWALSSSSLRIQASTS